MEAAQCAGLSGGEKNTRIGGRVNYALIKQAKARTRIKSDTELLEYAVHPRSRCKWSLQCLRAFIGHMAATDFAAQFTKASG